MSEFESMMSEYGVPALNDVHAETATYMPPSVVHGGGTDTPTTGVAVRVSRFEPEEQDEGSRMGVRYRGRISVLAAAVVPERLGVFSIAAKGESWRVTEAQQNGGEWQCEVEYVRWHKG